MAKLQETANTDVWRNSFSIEQLQTMRRQLAKAANQRMVRLENTTSDITDDSYTFGAYDVAQEYLDAKGRRRFSETKTYTDDTYALKHEINVLQQFINSKSSTIGGMHEIEKQRIASFEEKGIKFANNKEFYDFLNSNDFLYLTGNQKKKDGSYGTAIIDSDTIIDMYNRYREAGATPEQINEALRSFRKAKGRKSEKRLEKIFSKIAIKKSGNK